MGDKSSLPRRLRWVTRGSDTGRVPDGDRSGDDGRGRDQSAHGIGNAQLDRLGSGPDFWQSRPQDAGWQAPAPLPGGPLRSPPGRAGPAPRHAWRDGTDPEPEIDVDDSERPVEDALGPGEWAGPDDRFRPDHMPGDTRAEGKIEETPEPDAPPSGPIPEREQASAPKVARSTEAGGPDGMTAAHKLRFQRPQLVVIAVIVALGIGVAGWAVLRARPIALAAPESLPGTPTRATSTPPTPMRPSSGTAGSSASASAKDQRRTSGKGRSASDASPSVSRIKVHVTGAVKKPGVFRLRKGARVEDAIKDAGGTTRHADLGRLNLAQQLNDGQQLVIAEQGRASSEDSSAVRDPARGGADPVGPDSQTGHGTDSGGSASVTSQPEINVNDASESELQELSGVGPVTAKKIVQWREENGRFSAIRELQEVGGIGPKTFADLAPHVTVS